MTELREAVARIVDPDAWTVLDREIANPTKTAKNKAPWNWEDYYRRNCERSLSRADLILAAIPEAGKVEAVARAELRDAVAFFDKVKAATLDERIAVGTDHWDRLEVAARALAIIPEAGEVPAHFARLSAHEVPKALGTESDEPGFDKHDGAEEGPDAINWYAEWAATSRARIRDNQAAEARNSALEAENRRIKLAVKTFCYGIEHAPFVDRNIKALALKLRTSLAGREGA